MSGVRSRGNRSPDDSQTVFQWESATPAVPPPAIPLLEPTQSGETAITPLPAPATASRTMGANSPALLAAKRSLKETVERYLRDKGVPYISVDEAKKALFAGAKLRSFHFVVYRPTSVNWLVWAAQIRKESRQDMVEWQKVFGEGFVAVVAKQMKDATVKFRTLAGEEVELK